MVTGEGDNEFLFPGSDDDFDADLLEDEYDPLDREQGKYTKLIIVSKQLKVTCSNCACYLL